MGEFAEGRVRGERGEATEYIRSIYITYGHLSLLLLRVDAALGYISLGRGIGEWAIWRMWLEGWES